ncbi:MAG: AMP-binding protein, partial [Sulfolobaceae archaeon]
MKKGIPSTMNDEWQLNLHKMLEYAAKINSTTEVISDRRMQGGKVHKLNYKLIYERVCAITNALEGELDVKEGEIIGILDWNDHRYFESYYSIPSLAAVLLTLNFRLHPNEILYIIKHCKARGLLVDESLLQLAELLSKEYKFDFIIIMSDKSIDEIKTNLSGRVYGYEELIKSHPTSRKWEEIDEKTAAIAATTSGTTGMPKVVLYSHRSITLHAMAVSKDLRPTDVTMQVVPMFHATGWGLPFAATISACKQVYPGRPTIETLVENLITHKVTRTAAVPTVLLEILRRLEKMEPKPDLKGLKINVGGSEPPLSLVTKFAKYNVELQQGYGATETSPLVAFSFSKPELEVLPLEERFLRMKQGLVTFGVEVRVVDPSSGSDLPFDG